MTDDDLLETVRSELAGVKLGTPVQDVLARGNALRRNRRLLPAVGAGAAVAVAAAGLTLGLGAVGGSPAAHASLDGWTVTKLPDQTVSLTIGNQAESGPDRIRLRRALAAAGVPALVLTQRPACQLRLRMSPLTPLPVYRYHPSPVRHPAVIRYKLRPVPKGSRVEIVLPSRKQPAYRPLRVYQYRPLPRVYIFKPSGKCATRPLTPRRH